MGCVGGEGFWLSPPIVGFVGWMVGRRLGGADVGILVDYFVKGMSPSDIVERRGVTAMMVKSVVNGARERCGVFRWCVDYVVSVVAPFVERIPSVIKCEGGVYCRCLLCGAGMYYGGGVKHVKAKHRDFFVRVVADVIYNVLDSLGLRNGVDVSRVVDEVIFGGRAR